MCVCKGISDKQTPFASLICSTLSGSYDESQQWRPSERDKCLLKQRETRFTKCVCVCPSLTSLSLSLNFLCSSRNVEKKKSSHSHHKRRSSKGKLKIGQSLNSLLINGVVLEMLCLMLLQMFKIHQKKLRLLKKKK